MIQAADTAAFRSLAAGLLGLNFGDDKLEFLKDVLRSRMEEGGHDSGAAYLSSLEGPSSSRDELGRLAEALTVTETFFFRSVDQFHALTELALPARIQARSGSRSLRILSAGCASGEEPYTLAMLLLESFPQLAAWDIQIRAADVNPAMLAKAQKGLYSSWSLRETPAAMREKYFSAEGRDFRVREDIRGMVRFEARNFAEANSDLWEPGAYDIIFCRNMIMYFTQGQAVATVERIEKALAPEGYLFLGYAETLRGLSQKFHLCHSHATFYYQRLEAGQSAATQPGWELRTASPGPDLAALWQPGDSWVEAIQRASEKIAGLAERAGGDSPGPSPAAAVLPGAEPPAPAVLHPAWSLDLAMDLLRAERFSEAMDALQRLPPASVSDADVMLLRAVLLINLGKLIDAESACRSLLKADELNAGAHYILALCREYAGDLAAAEEQDKTAIYLDASFAMPWLHLGLLARRSGKAGEARRQLQQALALLSREDSSRVLLFGGGFAREGLAELCRNGLKSLEAA